MERFADQSSIALDKPPIVATYGDLQYRVAQKEHDSALRRALRENTMPGWITLSYEREPNYFQGATIEGDIHETVIGIDLNNDEIMGIGTRSVQKRYVDETPYNIGYLGQLRVERNYRNKLRALKYGFQFCQEFIHSEGTSPYYLTSIIADNDRAKRLLTSDLPDYPRYRLLDNMFTLALPTRSHKKSTLAQGVNIEKATLEHLDDIIDCLNRNNQRYQFASLWTKTDIISEQRCRGLSIDDFFVAVKKGKVVACLALWNQSRYKQVVVRNYNKAIKFSRPLLNTVSRVLGYPTLPRINSRLSQVYISHFAIDGDDIELALALLKSAICHAAEQGQELVLFGLSQSHPCLPDIQRALKHIRYTSSIYLVHWDDVQIDIEQLRRRPLHLDIAVL